MAIREISRRGFDAWNADEIGRRSNGYRTNIQGSIAKGYSFARAELAMARARGYAWITAARKNCHRAPRQDSLAARGARAWHFLKGNDRADQNRPVVRSTDAGNCGDQPAARFRHHRDGSCGFAARSQAHRYERRTTGAALENHGRGGEALPYEGAHSTRLQARRHLRRGI